MDELIASFTEQLQEAKDIADGISMNLDRETENVMITGLGGSGIGGKIASDILAEGIKVPVVVNNDYSIPDWVGPNTLVIGNSYSGNTEETLAALNEALQAGAMAVCISSGGKMAEIAADKGLDLVTVPGGNPPRSMLAYSLVQQLAILTKAGVAQGDYAAGIAASIAQLDGDEEAIRARAQEIAAQLHGKTAVIYAGNGYEGVAVRLRQQINENSKALCWHHVLPEMNHNELVGWAGGSNNFAVIAFNCEDVNERTRIRMRISKEVISRYTDTIIDIDAQGADRLQRSLYLIHLGDWVSEYLAQLKQVDSVEVNVIDYLKTELSKH